MPPRSYDRFPCQPCAPLAQPLAGLRTNESSLPGWRSYDHFPCQFQLFYRGRAAGSMWYDPTFQASSVAHYTNYT